MIRFNANLFRIAFLCASKEETRYYLNGVFVEPHPQGGVTLTTTDGHRMLSIRDESGFADESAIIRLPDLKACKPSRGERRDVVISTGENDASICSTIATVENGTETLEDTPIAKAFGVKITGADYPDYRRAVPSDTRSEGDIPAFNGAYLGDFGKIGNELAAHFGASKPPMRVNGRDASSPALVRWGGIDAAFGILMPMPMPIWSGSDLDVPAWFNAKPTRFAQAAE